MSENEVIHESETGGKKAGNLDRYDLIPPEPLRLLAHHFGVGSLKYDDDNWQKGYDWRLSFSALNRHLWQFWAGEDIDAETGSPHLTAVAWHAMALLWFTMHRPEFDTRPTVGGTWDQVMSLAEPVEETPNQALLLGAINAELDRVKAFWGDAVHAWKVEVDDSPRPLYESYRDVLLNPPRRVWESLAEVPHDVVVESSGGCRWEYFTVERSAEEFGFAPDAAPGWLLTSQGSSHEYNITGPYTEVIETPNQARRLMKEST